MVFRLGEKVDTQNKDSEKGNEVEEQKTLEMKFESDRELTKCLK